VPLCKSTPDDHARTRRRVEKSRLCVVTRSPLYSSLRAYSPLYSRPAEPLRQCEPQAVAPSRQLAMSGHGPNPEYYSGAAGYHLHQANRAEFWYGAHSAMAARPATAHGSRYRARPPHSNSAMSRVTGRRISSGRRSTATRAPASRPSRPDLRAIRAEGTRLASRCITSRRSSDRRGAPPAQANTCRAAGASRTLTPIFFARPLFPSADRRPVFARSVPAQHERSARLQRVAQRRRLLPAATTGRCARHPSHRWPRWPCDHRTVPADRPHHTFGRPARGEWGGASRCAFPRAHAHSPHRANVLLLRGEL
jgi:hypothetical protein